MHVTTMRRLINRAALAVLISGTTVVVALAFTSDAQAQEQSSEGAPYTAIRISWEPNPPAENIGWYMVEAQYRDQNVLVADTNNTEFTVGIAEFVAKFADPPELDSDLCVTITAARGNERSVPSDQTCFSLGGDGQEDPGSGVTLLSQPSPPNIELR